MGYAYCTSRCFGCSQLFCFNPVRVPSIRINDSREPICATCVARANPERVKNGLDPIVVHPDAYEPCDEEELNYD
jgi:hypothetical protein